MTQKFTADGESVPVTVIKCGPCTVVQKKTKKTDGYNALQLGFGETLKAQRFTKAMKGHFQKAKTGIFNHLGEVRLDDLENVNVGDLLTATLFHIGDKLHVSGITKGRGFQGVIKRHHKAGGPATHGSCFHRTPGSIGMRQFPGRVLKNTRLPGHMGVDKVKTKNLVVVDIDAENNLVFVKGAVPGYSNGLVMVDNSYVNLSSRLTKKEEPKTEVVAEVQEQNAEVTNGNA